MILHPAQSQIAQSKNRFRVVNCGRRFGKTLLSCWEMFAFVTMKEDAKVCYIAPTYQQARDIAWAELKRICEPVTLGLPNDTRLEIKIRNKFGGVSMIALRGWESVETLRGQAFDFLVLDEVSSYRNFWINWQEVLRPTLTDRIGHTLFISTPKGFNHFYDLYNLQDKDTDYKSFHFSSYDNPYLPFDEIEKAKKELPEDRFSQEYMADFRKTQGLVYKEFDRNKHVYTDENIAINTIDVLAGIDWGYTNPTAVHRLRKDSDRHYWIDKEYYKTGKTTEEIVEYVKTLKPNKVYPDPAEPDRLEIARKLGLNIREVTKDVIARIDCVRELLKQGRIHIHSSCINLIQEFETYMYPDKKPDKNEPELPIKENDHALDEIGYVLFMNEGAVTGGHAHVHYSQSAMPQNTNPQLPNEPKTAYTHIPYRL